MTVSELHTRAMLVSLRMSYWAARKYDKKISTEINQAHGASDDAGRYNKHLLPGDAPSYKALNNHIANTRLLHYEQTLAWSDDGWRLLPVKNYQKYTDIIRKAQHQYDSLLSDFIADYPTLRQEAKLKLNGMYKEEDYPSKISSRYAFGVEYSPVPAGDDFRVTLSSEEIEMIASRTEQRVKDAFNTAHEDAVKRLYDCVSKVHAKLAEPDGIFRDSLIGNAREMCDVLTRLNLQDDMRLETLRRQTELLASTEPQTLRDVPAVRLDTANRAQSILDAMQATYGNSLFA